MRAGATEVAKEPAALPEWAPGHIVAGKYTVRALIARSSWSRTYATIMEPNREVLLRVFAPDKSLELAASKHAALLTKLEPHALPILQIGNEGGLDFVASARSRHPSLASLVELCALTLTEGVALAESLGRALDAAHDHEITHGALGPQTVFVGPAPECVVQLSDFGMAPRGPRALVEAQFAAPEQLAGEPATTATDVYLAALVVFFALTGKSYWRAQDEASLREEQRGDLTPASLRATELGVTLPHEIDAIYARALAHAPASRTRTVGDFARALAKACTRAPGAPSIVEPPDIPKVIVREPPPRPPSRIADEPTVSRLSQPYVAPLGPIAEPVAEPMTAPAQPDRKLLFAGVAAGVLVALLVAGAALALLRSKPKPQPLAVATSAETHSAPIATTPPAPSSAPTAPTSTPTVIDAGAPEAQLAADEGELIVDCQPVQCDIVLVDAKKCSYPDPIRLKAGKHGVGISAKGYWGNWRLVDLAAGEHRTVTFVLSPKAPCPKGQKCK